MERWNGEEGLEECRACGRKNEGGVGENGRRYGGCWFVSVDVGKWGGKESLLESR